MLKLFAIYLLLINISAFFIMLIDKKKAINHSWRISEKALILFSVACGSIGLLLGMHVFRHKTKHIKFTVGVPTILIMQIALLLYIFYKM